MNSRNVRVSLNRPNGMKEVAKALGEDVEQLGGGHQAPNLPVLRNNVPRNEAPETLRRAVILWATQTPPTLLTPFLQLCRGAVQAGQETRSPNEQSGKRAVNTFLLLRRTQQPQHF